MPLPPIDPETAEPQTLDEIRDWHRGIVNAVVDRARRCSMPFAGIGRRPQIRGHDGGRRQLALRRATARVGPTHRTESRGEHEATVKVDYFRRVGEKLKDPLARRIGNGTTLSATKQLRPDFDDAGILDVLKEAHVMDNNIVGRYRECLRVRHWLGHGRYWAKPVEVDRFDPDDVYDRAGALLRAMPL